MTLYLDYLPMQHLTSDFPAIILLDDCPLQGLLLAMYETFLLIMFVLVGAVIVVLSVLP